jgi:hypothetical protein
VATDHLDAILLPNALDGRLADGMPTGETPDIPIEAGVPHPFPDEFAAQAGAAEAIKNNSLFHCFRNWLSRTDTFRIPQSPDARIGKAAAPEMGAGTMHTHFQAYSAILRTIPGHEHNTCSFPDALRYLFGSSDGFQD